MPERENVFRRVDVTVVRDTAHTGPFLYSETCDTFRLESG